MFSPICLTNFLYKCFSVWAVEKENKFLIGLKQFFFLILPVKKEIIKHSWIKVVDSGFEIGETIWWTKPMTNDSDGNAIKYSSWNVVWSLGGFRPSSKSQWIRELLLHGCAVFGCNGHFWLPYFRPYWQERQD